MIEKYYPAPRPTMGFVPTKYWPGQTKYTQPVEDAVTNTERIRAAKKGLSIEDYRARVAVVMKEQSGSYLQVGDTVWPIYAKDVKKMGQCIITGFCRHFDDYGEVDWNDPPFLLSVQSLADKSKSIQCSVGWVTKTRPLNIEEIINEC